MNDTSKSSLSISLAEQGFSMPPEWHPHAATWMAWPHNTETWPENLEATQHEYIELVAAIADDEPVMLMCSGESSIDQFLTVVSSRSQKLSNVTIVDIPTNDAWARDYAPTFVINPETNEQIGIDWLYNAWGGKYPPFDLDQLVTKRVCEQIVKAKPDLGPGCAHHVMNLCLEGGAIEIGANHVVLCTKSCALNPNRNPKMSTAKLDRLFTDHLGASATIWLTGDAITGDDTDGHIDQLARFTPSGTVLYAWCNDESDSQYHLLEGNFEDLKRGFQLLGKPTDLVPLPIPAPIKLHGQRLPASYCNFYITNRKVIVPQFDQPQDVEALKVIAEHFPNREVVGLPSTNISYGLGSFHCLTQQQPRIQ